MLRAFLPNLVIKRKFVAAYENGGTAVVTRFADVKEVLNRDADFHVVYGPKMCQITGGENFFLGMQNTPRYTRDVSNMRLVVRRDDVEQTVQPFAARKAAELVGAKAGRIDVPKDLTLRVPAQLVGHYFGTPGPVYAWHLPEILTPLPQDVVVARVAPIHCQLQDVGIARGEYGKAWMAARDHLRSQGFPPSVYGAFVLGGAQRG